MLLLVAASLVLLLSDLGSRNQTARISDWTSGANAIPGRIYRVAFAYFMPEPSRDACERGLLEGLAELGYLEGENLIISRAHAQGEIVNIDGIIRNFDNSPAEVIMTFSTPVLQGALAAARNKPVVFTYCVDPVAAGAGTSFSDHRPNVTGIGSLPPVADSVAAIQKALPKMKTLGTIYNNGEANSVRILGILREVCKEAGISLIEKSAPTPSEVLQAAQALVSSRVDAIYIPNDNTVAQAFDGIVQTAQRAGIPTVSADPDDLGRGVLLAVGVGYYHSGKAAAPLLGEVLNGANPEKIPFQNVTVSELRADPQVAERLGLSLPDEFLKATDSEKKSEKK
jgi:putative ABC transport system substrate-binding protein